MTGPETWQSQTVGSAVRALPNMWPLLTNTGPELVTSQLAAPPAHPTSQSPTTTPRPLLLESKPKCFLPISVPETNAKLSSYKWLHFLFGFLVINSNQFSVTPATNQPWLRIIACLIYLSEPQSFRLTVIISQLKYNLSSRMLCLKSRRRKQSVWKLTEASFY